MERYYSGFMHALIFLLGSFTGIAFIYLNSLDNIQQLITIFVPSIATLLAAYFGAKLAFNFQSVQNKRRDDYKNQINAKLAIYKLIDILNHLASYEMQIIDPLRNDPNIDDNFLMMGIKPTDTAPMKVEFDQYDLLPYSEGKYLNLLSEISASKSCYNFLLEAIERRSELHLHIQTIIARAGVTDSTSLTLEDIKNIIGDNNFHTLRMLTDSIVKDLPDNINKNLELIEKVSDALKEKYPSVGAPEIDFSKYLDRNTKTKA